MCFKKGMGRCFVRWMVVLICILLLLVGCTGGGSEEGVGDLDELDESPMRPDYAEGKTVDDIPEEYLKAECEKFSWPPSCSFIGDEEGEKLCEKCKELDGGNETFFEQIPFGDEGFELPFDMGMPGEGMGEDEISPGVALELPSVYAFPVILYDGGEYMNEDDNFAVLDPELLREIGFNTINVLIEYYWDYDSEGLVHNLGRKWTDEEHYVDVLKGFIRQAHYYGFNVMLSTSTVTCRVEEYDTSNRATGCYPVQFPCNQFSSAVPEENEGLCQVYVDALKDINLEWLDFADENNVECFH